MEAPPIQRKCAQKLFSFQPTWNDANKTDMNFDELEITTNKDNGEILLNGWKPSALCKIGEIQRIIVSEKLFLKIESESCQIAQRYLEMCSFKQRSIKQDKVPEFTVEFHDNTPFECCNKEIIKMAISIKFINYRCDLSSAITLDMNNAPALLKLKLINSPPQTVDWTANTRLTHFEFTGYKEQLVLNPKFLIKLCANEDLLFLRIDKWGGDEATRLASLLLINAKQKQRAYFILNHVAGHSLRLFDSDSLLGFKFEVSKEAKLADVIASMLSGWQSKNQTHLEIVVDRYDQINDFGTILDQLKEIGESVKSLK